MVHLAAINSEYPPFAEIKGRLEGLVPPLSRWASENWALDVLNESAPTYSDKPSYSIAAGNNAWGPQCEEWERLRIEAFDKRWEKDAARLEAETLFARDALLHQWGPAALTSGEKRPAYGTAFSIHDMLGLHFEYSDKIWNEDTLRYNEEVNLPLLQDLAREMRNVGINAFQTQTVMVQDYIFVPDAKVTSFVGFKEDSYTVTDRRSRELLLAYLLHKGLIKTDDPAIEAVFPLRTRNMAAEIDMAALLANLSSEVDIQAAPQYNVWASENTLGSHLEID